MTRIGEWLDGFLDRHRKRFKPGDWPAAGGDEMAEYVELWRAAFARNGVTEAEADEASRCCGENPPNYRREHLQFVMLSIKILRDRKATIGDGSGAVGTREEARAKSKDCEHCSGNGLTTVWYSRPDPARGIAPTAAAYCVCAHGRWIKRNHAFSSECRHLVKAFPDLEDVLAGRSTWLAEPPDLKASENREDFRWIAHKVMFKVPTIVRSGS